MKSVKTFLIIFTLLFFTIGFMGCYTQLGTRQDDRSKRETYSEDKYSHKQYEDENDDELTEENDNDNDTLTPRRTIIINQYYDDWYPPRVGFWYYYPSYYWPSYAFSVAYYDPWCYDYYWGYDPWWCGTPIIIYPIRWYYRPYYYYPWYSGYYYPYPYYRYVTVPVGRGTRDFGVTRGAVGRGSTNEYEMQSSGRTDLSLPTGSRLEGSSRRTTGDDIQKPSQRDGSSRSYTPRRSDSRRSESQDAERRVSDSRKRVSRGDTGTRSTRSSSRTNEKRQPQYAPDRNNEPQRPTIRESSPPQRSSPPSYTPPSPPPSRPESTPRSGDRGSSSGGRDSRGGNTRSGRE